jgi:signal peptide peptidase SppA
MRKMPEFDMRPVNRQAELSKVMQRIMDRPLAMHPSRAAMVMAALKSKYALNTLRLADDEILDGDAMDALAADGRQAAVAERSRRQGRIFDEADGVAIIPVWGSLTQSWGLDPYSGVTGYDGIIAKAIAASEDENIKAIWLDIDSGGGDVAGLKACTDILRSLSQREGGDKPIFAMANEFAYSAAYAIACCADKLFVPEFGGVGSIGVITIHATMARYYEKQGIDVTVIRSGEQKARANSVEILPEETRDHIQRQCDVIRQWFVNHVSECMPGLSQKTVRETEGLDYMGQDARAIGLVSDVCSEAEAWGKLLRRINR